MLRTLASIGHGIRALLRPQLELAIENTALRQQLAVLKQNRPRPKLSNGDRLVWVTLLRFWSNRTSAPNYLIFDGDRKFRGRVETAVKNMGAVPTRRAAPKS